MSIFLNLERKKKGWMDLKVSDILQDTHDTKTFILEDAQDGGSPFDYVAGQYLTFRFDNLGPKPLVRSYTMSSSPRDTGSVAFTVKIVDGGVVSGWLCNQLKVGDVLRARGPIGRFCFDPEHDPADVYMVAGGSGVTPFVSMIGEYGDRLGSKDCPRSLNLLVSHRTRADLIGQPVFDRLQGIAGVKVVTTLTREKAPGFLEGHIDERKLLEFFGTDLSGKVFLTCGPEAIMGKMVSYLRERGVTDALVKQESFFS